MTYPKGAMTSSINRGERPDDPGGDVVVTSGENR